MNDMTAAFHEYFEIVIADTPDLLKEVFSLRYQMLCINGCIPGFNAENYPDGLEKDEFDSHSLHLLLRHRASNTFIGTTRLIKPDPRGGYEKFPVELYTQFYPAYTNMKIQRQHSVEISRFAILSDFFRRKDDLQYTVGKISKQLGEPNVNGRRRFPHPMLGLAVGIIQMCAKYDIYHLFSIMDPALNRLFGFYGMQFEPIGPFANYHGQRRPYYVCLLNVLERMYTYHRDVWELATDDGRVWPVNLEHYKRLNGRQLDKPKNDISIVNC